jgi:hypothetical protein
LQLFKWLRLVSFRCDTYYSTVTDVRNLNRCDDYCLTDDDVADPEFPSQFRPPVE